MLTEALPVWEFKRHNRQGYKVCFPTGKKVLTEALPVWEFNRHNRRGYKVCFPTGKKVLTEALPVWEFKRHNRQGTKFVFLQPRRCLQRHFQTGNPKDTIDKQYPSYTNTPNLKKIIIMKGNSLT